MGNTTIGWTDFTRNVAVGCDPISPGCDNCYAKRRVENPFWRKAFPKNNTSFKVQLYPERISDLLSPKKIPSGSKVFLNSMFDIFHTDIPMDYIDQIMRVARKRVDVTFQVLTKRPGGLLHYIDWFRSTETYTDLGLEWQGMSGDLKPLYELPMNIYFGVSVENEDFKGRIRVLKTVRKKLKYPVHTFVSFEPLIGDVGKVDLSAIDWAIAGGESGPGFREVKKEWLTNIRDQCVDQKIPLFFKQWGGRRSGGEALLEGREYKEFPKGM